MESGGGGARVPVSYLFAFSCCFWNSQGKNIEVVCHSLLRWTTFGQNSPQWPLRLGWPCTLRLIASLSYTRVWSMWSFRLVFWDCGFHSGDHGIVVFASSVCLLMDENKRHCVCVCVCVCVWHHVTSWTAAHEASLSFIICQSCSNSCPRSQWCYLPSHPSSAVLFFCLHSFLASRSFPVSQVFASDSQSIGASSSASVLPVDIQGWFPWGLTGLISLLPKELSRVFSSTIIWKHPFLDAQLSLWSSSYKSTRKTIALIIQTFVEEWCLYFLICCLGLS